MPVDAKASRWGCEKISLYLELDTNPGDAPDCVRNAIGTLGLELTAITQDGKKQVPFGDAALDEAVAAHASALFGRHTVILESPKKPLHGPVSFVRIVTGADWGRSASKNKAAAREQFPCSIEVFWALSPQRPHVPRTTLDAFLTSLDGSLRVRTGAAGLTYAIIERPMMKDARRVGEAFGEALLARPHAHANHYARLDTRTRCVEPSWWMFLGPRHVDTLRATALDAFAPRRFRSGGVSIATSKVSPVACDAKVIGAQIALARALGPLYPPCVVADATHSPGLRLVGGSKLTIRHWMDRYTNPEFGGGLGFRAMPQA